MFEGFHPFTVFFLGVAIGAGGHLLLDALSYRFGAWLERRRSRHLPPFCPLSVIEVVSVPLGQETEMRDRNGDLFTLDEAKKMLDLFYPVAKGKREFLRLEFGNEAMYKPGNGHLVRLGRRGFHG